MERAAGFARQDTRQERLRKLQALLAAATPTIEDQALIAELHSLPSTDLASPLDVSPQREKEKAFEALLRQVEDLSRQPVLMVFEDIHWFDPSSRELLDRSIDRVANWPVMLVATFRPEFRPPWIGLPHVAMLALARLDRHEALAMIANNAGGATLPPENVEEIAERTDGVPLFIEELTNAVLESGPQLALSSAPHLALSIPATLYASLMARLDRLGLAAKSVAQKGAAIGREFDYELLASIADMPKLQVGEALNRLSDAGLLFVRGAPPQSTYIFKHALVQDAAYSTLLKGQRQEVHRRIGEALRDQFADRAEAEPEVLAHHFSQSNLAEPAIEWWAKGGELALRRSALIEAVAHLEKALKLATNSTGPP
jgi:predicted ATPase